MKRPRSSVDSRRLDILDKIRKQKEIRVEDLAEEFGLSLMTVRRDLQYLEDRRLITRFYGGAAVRAADCPSGEVGELAACRQQIARFAARFIAPGDVLFVNGSTTALSVLEYAAASRVRVYTNNGLAVNREFAPGITVHLTGGELRGHFMVGDYVMRNLLGATADKAFIGCAAVTAAGELCFNVPTEIGINEIMISRTAKDCYVLADHTKICRDIPSGQHYGQCTYEQPWTLITDDKADPVVVESLRAKGKQVYVVGVDDGALL